MAPEKSLPLTGITVVTENDIICGRGGVSLKHPGNLAYRKIVGINKGIYATCLKAEKLKISKSIVAAIREIDGRFLEREDGQTSASLDERDENGNPVTWRDIGDKKAIEKTSQALREGQPKLLKKLAAVQNAPVAQAPFNQSAQTTQQMHLYWNSSELAYPSPHSNIQQSYVPPPELSNSGSSGGSGFHPTQHMNLSRNNVSQPFHTSPHFNMQSYAPPPDLNNSGSSGGSGFQPDASLRLSALSRLPDVGYGLEGALEGETFDSFPRNSIVERGVLHGSSERGGSTQSWHDSWEANPAPLPYSTNPLLSSDNDNVFSEANQRHLLDCLGIGNGAHENKRSSVAFQIEQRPSILHAKDLSYGFRNSAVSLTSHLDDMSIFDTQSLDSGMDAAEREMELELLGEFEIGEQNLGLNLPSTSPSAESAPHQSILRRHSRWSHHQNFSPAATVTNGVDPGLIFTSTFDTKPGGINSGTDVSGLLGDRRKSAVAFEVGVERRRSSRMSMMSMFSRDVGSGYISIQSADIRDLIEMDSDSD